MGFLQPDRRQAGKSYRKAVQQTEAAKAGLKRPDLWKIPAVAQTGGAVTHAAVHRMRKQLFGTLKGGYGGQTVEKRPELKQTQMRRSGRLRLLKGLCDEGGKPEED